MIWINNPSPRMCEWQPVPIYHFNLDNSHGYLADEEGRDLPDAEAARGEALEGIRSIIAEDVLHGRLDLAGRLEVTDGEGRLLFSILFAEAVEASPANRLGA